MYNIYNDSTLEMLIKSAKLRTQWPVLLARIPGTNEGNKNPPKILLTNPDRQT